MTRALLDTTGALPAARQTITAILTPRETEVLGLIAKGHTNRQVAEILGLSVRTVESHRANLMDKLELQSRVELVRYAADCGLLEPDSS
jgi:two-component system response regulator NreC